MDGNVNPVTLALLGLALVGLAVAPSVTGHLLQDCQNTTESYEILVPAPLHPIGSGTEYLYLTVLRGTPAEPLNGTVNEIDAYVQDLHCQSESGDSYTVSANDGGNDLYEVRVRFYDHFGGLIDPATPCAKSHSGTAPVGTQYIVVIACKGAPLTTSQGSIPHPVTVRGTLTFSP